MNHNLFAGVCLCASKKVKKKKAVDQTKIYAEKKTTHSRT